MANAASLTTSRLILEPLAPAHTPDLFPVFADETTLRYWHHPPHRTARETEQMIRSLVAPPKARWWAIRLHENHQLIGSIGYLGTTIPGMGYILHSDYWQQGYGTEAVAAALEYGFTELSLNRVELWIHEANIASQQLARKLGFTQRGQFYADAHETRVFGLRADEWAARNQKTALLSEQREISFLSVRPVLPVRNVSETLEFYRDRLGFNPGYVSGNPPAFAVMTRGEWSSEQAHIHLQASNEASNDASIVHLFIMIGPSIDRLYEEYLAKGVTIIHPPVTQQWGIRDFSIEDNNGHHITFGSNA